MVETLPFRLCVSIALLRTSWSGRKALRLNTEWLVVLFLLLPVIGEALYQYGAALIPIFCAVPLELDAVSFEVPHEVLHRRLDHLPQLRHHASVNLFDVVRTRSQD